MYFYGKLEIDPSQMTLIKRVKPSRIFSKLLDALSFGQISEKQEHETFTALSILQQLSMGLRTLDIKNVIRLAIDEYDFYLDESGVEDDLNQAMFELKSKIDPLESEIFKTIYMVLEHHDTNLKYVIEVGIERKHEVGEYPIRIIVNAVIHDLKLNEGESRDDLINRMGKYFKSQEEYNKFVEKHREYFIKFMKDMEIAIQKVIRVDDIILETSLEIVRPKKIIYSPTELRSENFTQPFFFGYYGLNNFAFYTMLWAELLYKNGIYLKKFDLVDEIGNLILSVGEEWLKADEHETLNIGSPFEPPGIEDITYYSDNEYLNELKSSGRVSIVNVDERRVIKKDNNSESNKSNDD